MATRKSAAADVPWEEEVKKPAAKKAAAKATAKAAAPAAAKKTAAKKPIASSDAEEKKPLGPPPEGVKVPKNLGEAVDAMKTASDKVAAMNKEVEKEDAKRKWLKAWLIENLPKQGQAGAAGKLGFNAQMVEKSTPRAESWPEIYAKIVADYQTHVKKKTGMQDSAFALLQKRLGEATVKELWDAGMVVPGISKFTYKDLSVTKV
jgi:hypothetical protein